MTVSQDVDRARDDLMKVLPDDQTLSPGDAAFVADNVVLGRLGDLWAPLSHAETAARLRAAWDRLPPHERDDFPGLEAHIDRLTGHRW